ncbi:MAG: VanZ family protein [Candidatus Woesebacteria bacterium]|nr:VanZ family protein [Candidatus Woesebacteria bacterium]
MKILKFWLPPILWGLVIFSFSSFKVGTATEIYWKDFVIKKTAHIIEYGILATLLYRAMVNSDIEKKKAMWLSILIAFLYGLTDEFHQSFTPGRQPHLRDVIVDTIGASIFMFGVVGNISKMPEKFQNFAKRFDLK